jgi:hypothetical protein
MGAFSSAGSYSQELTEKARMKSPYERLSFTYTSWQDPIYLNWGIDRSRRARFADAWWAAMAERGWLAFTQETYVHTSDEDLQRG